MDGRARPAPLDGNDGSRIEYRHGERTKAAIAEQRKFSALLKMLRAGLASRHQGACAGIIEGQAAQRLDSERFRSAPRTCGRFRGILSLR
jgi:hypothetical protein